MKPFWIILGLAGITGCVRFEPRPLSPSITAEHLESRSLDSPELRSFLETNLHRAFPEWPRRTWDFETLTRVAFYYHPSLEVARADWNQARAGIQTAAGRLNPTVTATPAIEHGVMSSFSPWMPGISFDLPIETAGKRHRRIEMSTNLTEAARLNILTTAWQVRSNLRMSLLDFTAAQQRAALLQHQLDLQNQIVALLEQRFQAGAIARSELTLPRVVLTKISSDYADASLQVAQARVRIAEAVGLPVKAIAGVEFEFSLPLDADARSELTTAEARRLALIGRPDILAALAEYAASQSALQLEVAKQYPDFHLSPGYLWNQGNEGDSTWELGLTVELPILNQNQGPIAEAKARREGVAARFVALQAEVIAQIDGALATRTTALDQVARQRELAELTRQQATSAEAMFNAGASDKLELISAKFEAGANDLVYLDAQVKAQQAVGQLEDALRHPFEPWPDLEQGRASQAKQVKP